jgi:hypothetical protein
MLDFINNLGINSTSGLIGLGLALIGFFLILAGFGIISIEKITVQQGKITWILGIVFALLGIWLLLPEFRSTAPAVGSLEPSETLPVPTAVSNPLGSGLVVSGSPIVFNIPNKALWTQSIDGSYTVTGNEDTIAWSNVVIEGDIELSFDIQFQEPNGEGAIIIYGNGSGLSDEQLFIGFGPVHSKIMQGTPYDNRFLDDVWMTDVNINEKHSVIIKVVNFKASLFFDGIEILSAFIPEDSKTSGRIGLYKYRGESGMSDNGATYSNFRLTAVSVVAP